MGYQSEAELESNLVKQLVNQGFNKVKISDEEELKNNTSIDNGKINVLKEDMESYLNLDEKDENSIRTFVVVLSLIAQASAIKKLVQKIVKEYHS